MALQSLLGLLQHFGRRKPLLHLADVAIGDLIVASYLTIVIPCTLFVGMLFWDINASFHAIAQLHKETKLIAPQNDSNSETFWVFFFS